MNKYSNSEVQVRVANREDMPAVSRLIQELADFEKMPKGPKLSVLHLQRDGFDKSPPAFNCKVAELIQAPGGEEQIVGYALYFPTYSTWRGPAMMLEDLYVSSAHRRRGIGAMLFDSVAKEAYLSGCSRLDFHVLEWNPARAFYEQRGATDLTGSEQWLYYRLAGDALRRVAES